MTPPASTPAADTPQATKDRWKTVHERAMRRWKLVTEAESTQRAQELEDLKFARGRVEDQWDASVVKARQGGIDMDGTTTPSRPTLVVDKLDQPVTSIVNETRRAKLAILIKAKGQGANDDTAEVLQGLIRAIEVDSNAHAARMWAFQRAVQCGRGYYRLDVAQREDGDFDLDLVIKSIANQGSVYLDPFAVEPDRSDMKWGFITGTYQKDEYAERWGDAGPAVMDLDAEALESLNDLAPDWVTADNSYRVAEYYEVETVTVPVVRLGHETVVTKAPPPGYRLPATVRMLQPGELVPPGVPARDVTLRRVMLYTLNALEILNETLWNGRYIPIIPVFGKISNVDGTWSYAGTVTKAKDPQRLYNVTVSGAVETAQSMSKSPYIAAWGQIERFKSQWDTMNLHAYPVLYYDPVHVQGTLLPQPNRSDNEPQLMGHAMLLQQADADIKAATGRWDASLGQLNPSDRSGKAIQKLQQQSELGSSHYVDQLASISMFYEGTVLLDIIPVIYDRPGRVVRILGEEEDAKPREVTITTPEAEQQQAPGFMGRMVQGVRSMIGGPPPEQPDRYDLSKGQYAVVPSVGPSSQTQKEDNLALLQGILEAAPDLAPNFLDIMAENMDGPIARKLAARMKAMNPNLPPEDQDEIPPAAQAMIQQLQQQLEEQQQALQEAQQAVATDQAKQQATLQIAQLRAQTEMTVHRLKLQGEMAKLRAQITSEEERARFDAAMELAIQNDEQAHEIRMKELEIAHQQRVAAEQRAHEVGSSMRAEGVSARADLRKAALTPPKTGRA